ncbi:MAG TPA: DUF983 domain-containing protein [Gemmatimonadales bacterium]|nr:DUF983 domain-containing protein [Gemmatimonadales bacterium]
MLGRAVRRRCPRCGGGPLFTRWIRMADHCPRCGLAFSRGESGYQLGAMWFNLLFAESVAMTVFLTTVYLTWPDPPWDRLQIQGPVEAIVSPIFFYPFSKTLFLAFDLAMRPAGTLEEHRGH